MRNLKNPPKEIYFLTSTYKNRLYMSRGHVKQALSHMGVYSIANGRAKVWSLDMGEWIDVTEEFK